MEGILMSTRTEGGSWTPPVNKILAYFHGGRILTETLPLLGRFGVVASAFLFSLGWISYWAVIYLHYERWSLVLAALVHYVLLTLAYLSWRIVWLRLGHLRHLPPGETCALRSLPILLRLTAESFSIGVVSFSLIVFAIPSIPEPAVVEAGGALRPLGEETSKLFAGLAIGLGTILMWIAVCALFVLVVFYGLANAIETYLAIEQNTRNYPARKDRHDDLVRQAGE